MDRRADESYEKGQLLWPKLDNGPMLRLMMTLVPRRLLAGWVAVALVMGSTPNARAEEEESTSPPSQNQPPPTRTTEVVSTEAGGTVRSEPSPPEVAPTPLPNLPNAAPPTAPTVPTTPTAPDGAASSEPPAPSEYDYAADTDPAALNDFRDTLSPYGTWEDDATYGVVWVPSSTVVGADFAPYVSHGHWGLGADNAWIWISDFSWGWAPFHYGRWTWIGGRGWGWIPGRVYAPAWVVWRTGFYDDYYVGWAPMPPSWYWRRGWAYRLGFAPYAPYVFCSASYAFAPHVRTHIAPPARVSLIAPRTRPYVAASPSVASPTYASYAMTRGPSVVDAHIPTASVPAQRVTADPRAVSFARQHPPSRSFAATQAGAGAFTGRGDVMARPFPTTHDSRVYTTRPSAGASLPGPQHYSPRPLSPSGPMQPVMPVIPRPSPMAPSIPRSYSPSSGPLVPSVPRSYSPPSAPVVRPMAPSAPMYRPSAPPAANVSRPSVVAPRPAAPAIRSAPVAPRISR